MEMVNRLDGEVVTSCFQTQYRRALGSGAEVCSAETKTEMAYVPPEVQIREMTEAGARLIESRRARFAPEVVVDPEDPPAVLDQGADLVDVSRAAAKAVAGFRAEADAEAAKVVQAAKAAEEARIEQEVQKRLEKVQKDAAGGAR